jgi:8-oxo-dGTP diphosphatase
MPEKPYHQIVKTPELDVVRIVSLQDNEVLLVKESDDPNWKLPGGKIHAGETIFNAVVREIDEELGVLATEENIVNYLATNIPHSENIRHIFLMTAFPIETIQPTEEVAEARYFAVDDLPDGKFREHISSAVSLITSAN